MPGQNRHWPRRHRQTRRAHLPNRVPPPARRYRRHIDTHQGTAALAGAMQGGSHQFLCRCRSRHAPAHQVHCCQGGRSVLATHSCTRYCRADLCRACRLPLAATAPTAATHHAVTQQNGLPDAAHPQRVRCAGPVPCRQSGTGWNRPVDAVITVRRRPSQQGPAG